MLPQLPHVLHRRTLDVEPPPGPVAELPLGDGGRQVNTSLGLSTGAGRDVVAQVATLVMRLPSLGPEGRQPGERGGQCGRRGGIKGRSTVRLDGETGEGEVVGRIWRDVRVIVVVRGLGV
jgi:hypothetical protein